jgi:hypothetical protein
VGVNPLDGCAASAQFVREFAKLGLTRSVGGVLALALSRELTPVVTCIILAGRLLIDLASWRSCSICKAMHTWPPDSIIWADRAQAVRPVRVQCSCVC